MIDEKKAQDLISQGEGQHIEFKENVPSKVRELSEEVCAFANSSGGYVLIGVNDNQGFSKVSIDNSKRSAIQDSLDAIEPKLDCELYTVTIEGHNIWVIEVPEGNEKPYFSSGSVFVRRGPNTQKLRKPSDVRQLFEDSGTLHYDEALCKWFDFGKVLGSAVREFKEQAGITSKASDMEIITNLELLGPKGEMTNVVPMFFSDECGKAIPQAVVRCFRFKGTDKVHILDAKTFGGPLLNQYNLASLWLKERLSVQYVMQGTSPRKEVWEIPLDAIKEALTNSICHRDYYETGATITVELFDDRLEISNPGGLLPSVAKDFGHKSLSRNPKIFELFTRMHLVEKVGSGIPRMLNLMEEAHLPAPIYKTEGFFTVVLYKTTPSSPEYIDNKEKSKEKSKEKTSVKVLRLITNNPRITTAELALECDLSDNTIYKVVRKLREAGQIYRKGGDKGGEWIVVQN